MVNAAFAVTGKTFFAAVHASGPVFGGKLRAENGRRTRRFRFRPLRDTAGPTLDANFVVKTRGRGLLVVKAAESTFQVTGDTLSGEPEVGVASVLAAFDGHGISAETGLLDYASDLLDVALRLGARLHRADPRSISEARFRGGWLSCGFRFRHGYNTRSTSGIFWPIANQEFGVEV